MATYNGEKFIREQLESILPQLSDNDEVIVSDDGSNDKTLEIIDSFQDVRIKVVRNEGKHSPTYNFENALNHAQGDYIFLCDQDDVWLPGKVAAMSEALQSCDLVVSDCKVVDVGLNVTAPSFFKLMVSGSGFWKNFYKNTYIGCCMAFKKGVLEYVLPFPEKIAMHDSWIGLSVEMRGKVMFLDEPLLLYRRHGNNASASSSKSDFSFYYKLKYRMYMLYKLVTRWLHKR